MQTPLLAIVIPYYKLSYFKETLQSLYNQTNPNFKVYIGDDASPEHCYNLLNQFTGKFDFTYHRFENNLGGESLTKQWERCIALSAKEPWLMLLGDDDILGENVVEEFYHAFAKHQYKFPLIRFASKLHYQDKGIYSPIFNHPEQETYAVTYFKKLQGISRSSLSEYIFQRKVYEKHRFKNYPLAWNSDDRAWFDFSNGKEVLTLNEALVTINISNSSISGSQKNLDLKRKSEFAFLSFLLWSKFLIFKQKVDIAKLLIQHYNNSLSKIQKLQIQSLFLLHRIYNKLKL